VAGLARSGQAAARALAARSGAGPVSAWDIRDSPRTRRAAAELSALGVECELGGDGVALLERARCVVRSPGIPLAVPLLAEAARRGVAVLDELELGWRLDRRPAIGITGTNGKSTVAELVRVVLEGDGRRPAVAGNTTFGPPLSGLPAEAADIVVAEVSSYQLEACPVFLPDVAVVTNLSVDHLERHRNLRAYGEAKRRIAVRDRAAAPEVVVGAGGAYGRRLVADCEARGARVATYGRSRSAAYRLEGWRRSGGRSQLRVRARGEPLELATRLLGVHNALNALAALAVADVLRVPRELTLEALAGASAPPGRLEAIDEGQPFDVLVDYAHNPEGIRTGLRAGRALLEGRPGGSLRVVACAISILVRRQRHQMGRVAAAGADDLVLTTDRILPDEPVHELPAGLVEGAREAGGCEVVPDRAEALARVLGRAAPGDVVLILGRGSRRAAIDDQGRPSEFDDREEARRILRELRQRSTRRQAIRSVEGPGAAR
jgi:UDP-N-acetylmuramoylalanine-D-glutamate ligase